MGAAFISHRGSDATEAIRLAEDLRTLGHDVWLDVDEIGLGDSIVDKMEGGLKHASVCIMLFSDDPTAGPWMDREWMSTLARQLEGEGIRLLPARIGVSTGPSLLRDLKYADLSADWSAGVAALSAAIGTA